MKKTNDLSKNNRTALTVWRIILTVLCTAVTGWIFWNSSLSADESTEHSSPITDLINSILHSLNIPLTLSEGIVRKLAHFTEYAILGILLVVTVYLYVCRKPHKLRKTALITLPIGALIPVCDELIQIAPAGRSCEVRDMLIDFSGIAFSTLIVIAIISIKEKRKKKLTERRKDKIE